VRREKVDAIKERLAAGAYEVDAKAIAQKLLRSNAELAQTLER
jgi:flagellar biosynthesis anti-sigma factor FlgM